MGLQAAEIITILSHLALTVFVTGRSEMNRVEAEDPIDEDLLSRSEPGG